MHWVDITPELINEVANITQGKRVLEVFAGHGKLAKELRSKGISIHPTSLLMESYDGCINGAWSEVEIIDAVSACKKYKGQFDYLLCAWPINDDTLLHCALIFEAPIIYIGELHHEHPLNKFGTLSGTASDSYFENVDDLIQPKMNLSRNSALCLHQLKTKLRPDFKPNLLIFNSKYRKELVELYEDKLNDN